MTELGRGVNKFERRRGLLEGSSSGRGREGLSESDDTLLCANDASLEEDEVVVDNTIVRKAAHWVNRLLCDVGVGGSRGLRRSVANSIDLLVELSAMVVTVLTGSGHSVSDGSWMPSSDTGNLSETSVGLSRELLGAPSSGDTLVSVTLCDTNDVDGLVNGKDGGNINGLLEMILSKFDLVGDRATVDLNLHEVSLLLLEAGLSDLSVGEDSDDSAVLADALELSGNALTAVLRVLLGVLGEGLLLRSVPVLIEATLNLVGEVLGPDGGEGSKTTGSLDVADHTDDNHRRSLDDGDSLNDLTLVHLRSGLVEFSDDMGHACLVAHHGG